MTCALWYLRRRCRSRRRALGRYTWSLKAGRERGVDYRSDLVNSERNRTLFG